MLVSGGEGKLLIIQGSETCIYNIVAYTAIEESWVAGEDVSGIRVGDCAYHEEILYFTISGTGKTYGIRLDNPTCFSVQGVDFSSTEA
jgi:hypothetical protein